MNIFTSGRYFTLFDYKVSHSQLLIRSQKSEIHMNNIDIIVFGVKFLQIPKSFWGLSIEEISGDYGKIVHSKISVNRDIVLGMNLYAISTQKLEYYVFGAFCKIYVNKLDFSETSLGVLEIKGREIELNDDNRDLIE